MIASLRGAPVGYHGFFTIDEVQDDLLEDVYEHDLWTIDEAEEFANDVAALATDTTVEAEALLEQIENRFETIETKIDERRKILADL